MTTQVREERRPPREEVEEVAPGVLRIQLPISLPGLGHVNCYVLEDRRGVALVDPGLPGPRTWRHLKKQLASAGFPVDCVHTVVVTHSHPDHFGQAARFKSRVGAEIVTHRNFRTFLDPVDENDDEVLTVHHGTASRDSDAPPGLPRKVIHEGPLNRETPWGGKPYHLPLARKATYWAMKQAAGRFVATPAPTKRVEDADIIELGGREWVAVHTPGHTQDHLCLFDPANGIMLSGDHVLPTITPHISGMTATEDPLADFFESLDRMHTFTGVTTVLPAHGMDFEDLAGRADSIKIHHEERLQTLREASDEVGRGTVEDYMKQLFQPRSWGSMAESETYAHLEHLRLLNDAEVSSDGEQLRYKMK